MSIRDIRLQALQEQMETANAAGRERALEASIALLDLDEDAPTPLNAGLPGLQGESFGGSSSGHAKPDARSARFDEIYGVKSRSSRRGPSSAGPSGGTLAGAGGSGAHKPTQAPSGIHRPLKATGAATVLGGGAGAGAGATATTAAKTGSTTATRQSVRSMAQIGRRTMTSSTVSLRPKNKTSATGAVAQEMHEHLEDPQSSLPRAEVFEPERPADGPSLKLANRPSGDARRAPAAAADKQKKAKLTKAEVRREGGAARRVPLDHPSNPTF